jgi:hypothetical protein
MRPSVQASAATSYGGPRPTLHVRRLSQAEGHYCGGTVGPVENGAASPGPLKGHGEAAHGR